MLEILGTDFQLCKTENSSVREQLDKNMESFILSKNMCACDLYDDLDRGNGEGLRCDLIQSLSLLLDKIDRLIFSIHWYSGNVETEKIEFSGYKKINIKDIDPTLIKPDEVFEISGKKQS